MDNETDLDALRKDWERLNIKCGFQSLRIERLEKALQELVSAHMRMDDGKSKVFGHLIQFAREALKGEE